MTAIALRDSTLHCEHSDAELERRLANFLFQRRVPGVERIHLIAHGGVVAITGQTPTRFAKWLCIECCRRVAGVIRVIDNVQIEPAVNKQPEGVPICKEIDDCRKRQFDDPAADDMRRCISFRSRKDRKRRTPAASNSPKLMAAA